MEINRIRYLRLLKGLSQKEMATSLGITQQAYARYENDTAKPSFSTLKKIGELLDIPENELITNLYKPYENKLNKNISFIESEQNSNNLQIKKDNTDYRLACIQKITSLDQESCKEIFNFINFLQYKNKKNDS